MLMILNLYQVLHVFSSLFVKKASSPLYFFADSGPKEFGYAGPSD